MSLGSVLMQILKIAPAVLALSPLAPIAPAVAAAMAEAEQLHGPGSGAAKLAHVVGIAQDAAAAVNAQAGRVIIHPDLIPSAAANIVGAIITVANVAGKDPRFLEAPAGV